ncbi:MAG: hypothetical protein AAGM16_03215 [Pseudomonadota bacterium]
MATVSTVEIELRAESARLRADLDKVSRQVRRFGQRNQSTFNRLARDAQRSFARVGSLATVAGAGLTALSISAARAADNLAKTADKLGVGTRELAGLQLAAKLTGVETNKLNLGLQRLTRRVAEAAQGTGEAQDALRELGIDAKVLTQLAPDEQFKRIGEAFGQISNQSDKVRLGFKLFDSEGVDLIRTLDLQRAGLEAAQRQAELYGVAISRVDAKQIELAGDALTRAQTALQGIGTTTAVQGAALVAQLANNFTTAAENADGYKDRIFGVFETISIGAGLARNAFITLQFAAEQAFRGIEAAKQSETLFLARRSFSSVLGSIPFVGADLAEGTLPVRSDGGNNPGAFLAQFNRGLDDLANRLGTLDDFRERYRGLVSEFALQAASSLPAGGAVGDGSPGIAGLFAIPDNVLEQTSTRLEEIGELYKTFAKQRTAAERRAAQERVQIERSAARQQLALRQGFTSQAVNLLQVLGTRNRAFQVASIALEKGLAIKRILLQSRVASIYAYASQLIPGDPTSIARAEAARQASLAIGRGTAALAAAAGVAQIAANARGAAELGSAANPAFAQSTDPFSSSSGFGTAEPQRVVNITVAGDVVGQNGELVLQEIRTLLEENDELLFTSQSRQALEISGRF